MTYEIYIVNSCVDWGAGGSLPQGKTELIKCSNSKGLKNMVGHQPNTPLTPYGKHKQS